MLTVTTKACSAKIQVHRQANNNTARSGLTAIAMARKAALLLLTIHDYQIPAYAVGNDFYRQALGVDLRAKREYADMVLSAMGEIKCGQFSYIKGLLHLSDEAFLHQMTDPRRNLDDRLRGNYGCFSTMALKLALILAIMDWADAGANQVPHITTAHWSQGLVCVKGFEAILVKRLRQIRYEFGRIDVARQRSAFDDRSAASKPFGMGGIGSVHNELTLVLNERCIPIMNTGGSQEVQTRMIMFGDFIGEVAGDGLHGGENENQSEQFSLVKPSEYLRNIAFPQCVKFTRFSNINFQLATR